MKILIIEDEIALSKSIATYLKQENYLCETATNFNTAIEKVDSYDYDCILLDISLPDGNGLSVLKNLKENDKTDGVIIISAKDSIDDKIAGLTLGADDYIPKPFHLSELSARIAAVIRRRRFNGGNILVFHEITIDTLAKTVTANHQTIDLTRKEYDLLLYFTINKNRVLSKTAIAEHLSGENADVYDNYDFIYAHIKNMKKKLAAAGCNDYLKSVYGMGYKFEY
ncbi:MULTISPECIES: response regulator transcription factor [Elizabethkingia]|uniref:DNA-binding response regulator n=2 Tax=Elizabethkingia TaxID=308865 RepID=A0A494J8T4_9FLAO|nr:MULTISPECIES: response regulator transcription factor [Elizabethkingia]AQX51264.1 two-component system response regulator [Elizabethkingia anophelis]MCT4189474.1 response regulator transcription factor [Elizabethkingia anophelis]MCT4196753.1 response regulator transcription factor [Elizabethkingia anophelis]MCT4225303.1 response regulator transcription factor [Elizabethkingia anophelis]MCT4306894.1 response regulator transcription factor [Elizabethkingia anophelis]